MGSKNRIAKYILPFLQEHLNGSNYFVDAFCGGCNLIDKLDYPKRIANDCNQYLITMFRELQSGWIPPVEVSREQKAMIRDNKESYPQELVAYCGFICSFNNKWFQGYAGNNTKVKGGVRHYQSEKRKSLLKQMERLDRVIFYRGCFTELVLPPNSVIYCDPPYEQCSHKGTKYAGTSKFDYNRFWQWCRNMTAKGHKVFVSEYNAPEDFKCVWQMEVTNSMSTKTTYKPIEKLFTYEQQ